MLQPVAVGHKTLADYTHIVGWPLVDEIRKLAEPLQGKRVLHLSATAFGGGVSEILYTLVPLMRDVGLDAEWQVIYGREEFFNATKLMHNALQGAPQDLTDEQWDGLAALQRDERARAVATAGTSASSTTPSPRPCTRWCPRRRAAGCGAATSTSRRPTRRRSSACCPTSSDYPGVGVPHAGSTSRRGWTAACTSSRRRSTRWRPRTWRSRPRTPSTSATSSGIDVDRPLICQVSRFDPWKDPLGVIDAYRLVKEEIPDVQLALVGSMATDDPEGWDFFNATIAHAEGDPDIHILNNFNNVGAIEVNAFQSHADVLIQKSTREGFGLTVSEAIWKARPFIGGDVGGIPLQVKDGESGFLVSTRRGVRPAHARDPARPRAGQGARPQAARSTCARTS